AVASDTPASRATSASRGAEAVVGFTRLILGALPAQMWTNGGAEAFHDPPRHLGVRGVPDVGVEDLHLDVAVVPGFLDRAGGGGGTRPAAAGSPRRTPGRARSASPGRPVRSRRRRPGPTRCGTYRRRRRPLRVRNPRRGRGPGRGWRQPPGRRRTSGGGVRRR